MNKTIPKELGTESFMINILIKELGEEGKDYYDTSIWGNEYAIDALLITIRLIKNEMSKIWSPADTPKEMTAKMISALRRFSENYREKGDVERTIVNYIRKLKRNEFYPSFTDLEKSIKKLRKFKIRYYETILTEYKKDKEKYNLLLDKMINSNE